MLVLLFFLSVAHATDCSTQPMPADGRVSGAWWREYAAWCSACGGTPFQDNTGGGCRGLGEQNKGSGQADPLDDPLPLGKGLPIGERIFWNGTNQIIQSGIHELLRPPTAEEQEAARQREIQEQQRREAEELERQRLLKAKNDKLDAEAQSTMVLLDTNSKSAPLSDDDLLKDSVATPPPSPANKEKKEMTCAQRGALIDHLEKEGLRRLDINIGKTRKMLKQAADGAKKAYDESNTVLGDAASEELRSRMADFAKSEKAIEKAKGYLKTLKGGQLANADNARLSAWVDGGITLGSAVIDNYKKIGDGRKFNFSDPKNASKREQMIDALKEFNEKFMDDTGAWELAGENLSAVLGPEVKYAFKGAVVGIKFYVAKREQMISEDDLNEQKYLLGNMQRTRSEMAQRVKVLKQQQTATGCGAS